MRLFEISYLFEKRDFVKESNKIQKRERREGRWKREREREIARRARNSMGF